MKKTRLLWVGDAVVHSGFARVTHSILDLLHASNQYEIGVLGVSYHGKPHRYPYPIWPAIQGGDPHGFNVILTAVEEFQPEIVVLFHDLWIVRDWIKKLKTIKVSKRPKIVTYSPIDAEGLLDIWVQELVYANQVCTYTEFGRKEIEKAGIKGHIHVIPHGVDLKSFHEVGDKASCRALMKIEQKRWVVMNANRNQPRKRIDLTIKSFVRFVARLVKEGKVDANRKPLLYLHMDLSDQGWPLVPLMRRECKSFGLNVEDWLAVTNPMMIPLQERDLNVLYNCADVGINTGMGEGWGLVAFEMGAIGIPQLLLQYAASAEIFRDAAYMVTPDSTSFTHPMCATEGAVASPEAYAQGLYYLYTNPKEAQAFGLAAKSVAEREDYRWLNVANQFHQVFQEVKQ